MAAIMLHPDSTSFCCIFIFLLLLLRCTSLSHDGVILLKIKKEHWKDPRSALSNWNDSDQNPCAWKGISCDKFNTVTTVDLTGACISGNLTSAVCRLGSLKVLILQANAFTGPFPHGLLLCNHLRELDLSSNQFAGTLPTRISELSKLRVLNLAQNSFRGSIPPAFGMLSKLEALFFHENRLSGPIPHELAGLSLVSVLQLDHNFLSGEIPKEIMSLKKLNQLNLGYNRLTGEIPAALNDMISLDLSNNLLSGRIPPELGRLTVFNVSNNDLSGRIPHALDNPTYKKRFLGNPKLCGGQNLMLPPCSLHKLSARILCPPLVILAVALCSICLCLCCSSPGKPRHTTTTSSNSRNLEESSVGSRGAAKEVSEQQPIEAEHKDAFDNLYKSVAILVPTTIALFVFIVTIDLKDHGIDKGKTIAFDIFLVGDSVALFASIIVALIFAISRPFRASKLVLFSKVVLCTAWVFVMLSCVAVFYLVLPPAQKWVAIGVALGTLAIVCPPFFYLVLVD